MTTDDAKPETGPEMPQEIWGLACMTGHPLQFITGELTLFSTREGAENERCEYDDEEGVMVPILIGVPPRYRDTARALLDENSDLRAEINRLQGAELRRLAKEGTDA